MLGACLAQSRDGDADLEGGDDIRHIQETVCTTRRIRARAREPRAEEARAGDGLDFADDDGPRLVERIVNEVVEQRPAAPARAAGNDAHWADVSDEEFDAFMQAIRTSRAEPWRSVE